MGKAANPLLRFLFLSLLFFSSVDVSEAKRRAVSIPDELDDVADDEEDEAWRQWGRKRDRPDRGPPPDFSRMNPTEIQAEMMKSHTGPAYGFVKLRLGEKRSREDIPMIAMRWSKVLRTGAIEAKFMAVDLSTIMFTMERGQDIEELKDFILSQPEAYEMKIGDQVYRRPGDPPLDEVMEMLRRKKSGDSSLEPTEESLLLKEEL